MKFSRILTEKAQLVFTLKPVARKSTGSCSPGFVPPVLDFALPCGAIVTGGRLPTDRVGPSTPLSCCLRRPCPPPTSQQEQLPTLTIITIKLENRCSSNRLLFQEHQRQCLFATSAMLFGKLAPSPVCGLYEVCRRER